MRKISAALPSAALAAFGVLFAISAYFFVPRLWQRKVEHVTVMQRTITTPAFEVVSYKIYMKNFGKLTEPKKLMGTWGLEYGTATMYYTFDAEVKLGVRDPSSIRIERSGDAVIVDADSIVVEVLDVKVDNYSLVGFDTSNVFVPRSISLDGLFESHVADKETCSELSFVDENVEAAKKNFMLNYERLCASVQLAVVWR